MSNMPRALSEIVTKTHQHLVKQRERILPFLEGPGVFAPKRVVNFALIPETRNHFTFGYIFGLFMAQVFQTESLRNNPPSKETLGIALKKICSGLYGDYAGMIADAITEHVSKRGSIWWRFCHLADARLFEYGEDFARYQIIEAGLSSSACGVETAVAAYQTGKISEFLAHVKFHNARNRSALGE